jgi:hypothetical protein
MRKQTQTKQIHNMCWTPLYVNKHKQNKYTICVGHHYTSTNTKKTNTHYVLGTTMRKQTQTTRVKTNRVYAAIVMDITTRNSERKDT